MPCLVLNAGISRAQLLDDLQQFGERSGLPREDSRVAQERGNFLGSTRCQSCQTREQTVMGLPSEKLHLLQYWLGKAS